jgi:hypothetical protein
MKNSLKTPNSIFKIATFIIIDKAAPWVNTSLQTNVTVIRKLTPYANKTPVWNYAAFLQFVDDIEDNKQLDL